MICAMETESIRTKLFELQDIKYRDFQAKLMPTVQPQRMIGVRTPALRDLAKELFRKAQHDPAAKQDLDAFLEDLPHKYFDEDQLHAFIISLNKDFGDCTGQVEAFLPYVDNWATCDQLSPKVFSKHKAELLPFIRKWIGEPDNDGIVRAGQTDTYTVRFGIGMLMQHFLDDAFRPEYPELVANISSPEYYVNMMRAWYFATALAKQWDACIPYIEERRLDDWTQKKTIQKAIESFRITPEQKEYLRTLK